MIFLGGIHGAGKSTFCSRINTKLDISIYTASGLIKSRSSIDFSVSKKVSNVRGNQNVLIEAVNEIKETQRNFILDGHFCLLNQEGNVTPVEEDVFHQLDPSSMIVLKAEPIVIQNRLRSRDGSYLDLEMIHIFQTRELDQAAKVAMILNIPLLEVDNNEEPQKAIELIESMLEKI